MLIRPTQLAGHWYPDSPAQIASFLETATDYLNQPPPPRGKVVAAVVPHAGWVFSGKLIARVLARAAATDDPPALVVVLGGHLGTDDPLVSYEEDAWATPLGPMAIAKELYKSVGLSTLPWSGPTQDNTIEVVLPLVKYFFPKASLLAFRAPPSAVASQLGQALAQGCASPFDSTLVVASTDLTHYGPAYGFAPAGLGPAGATFRRQNDEIFIKAALAMDQSALLATHQKRAACSAGAAMAAAKVAELKGAVGTLIDHYASSDVSPERGESAMAVGYAGLEYAVET